jgi:hypothetical protein
LLTFSTFIITFISASDQNPDPECIPVPVPQRQKVSGSGSSFTTLVLIKDLILLLFPKGEYLGDKNEYLFLKMYRFKI